jgi:HNH endonuclease
LAQPTNAITAEYLRQLDARRAPGGSPGPWRKRSELERLLDRTALELHPTLDSCRVFTGPANPYGRIGGGRTGGPERSTHRLGWTLLRGPIPDDMELHHRCERHACWNPDHLELATHAENLAHSRKYECKHGHPLSGDNLWVNLRTGQRKCRACNRAAQRAFRERHRAPRNR